ncbi:hypothetical protein KCTC52924_00418 [Arenibacter antarcticus]|uniref:RagB/SusD family nutrient uptake outer membrane protein n=1 Tax=Arenibacter antarcticus TaxID=2040469 RepID=A0ABW5VF93_9FLAO|nr:RagB/SusD family nutrient uptake outer membrane protein [Arenibacter sp. H213]MCM4169385.1 hypothetical protein [Arenibacter sp. H213]
MKNIKPTNKIMVSLLIILSILTGCDNDYFETQPDNLLSIDEIFTNRGQTERWWAGLFSEIPDMWGQPYGGYYYSISTDELDASNHSNPAINSGALNASTTPVNHSVLYQKIRLASIFLERVDDNEEILSQKGGVTIIRQYKGEVRFLRAYYYWLLMKEVGPVVIVPTEPGTPESDFQIPRSTWDESVKFVLSEIEAAKNNLPDDYYLEGTTVDGTQIGRINKIIATAVESQILLYHASPLYNGNSEMTDFRNPDGTQLINSTYDASRWETAAIKAKEAIDIAEAAGKGLFEVEDTDPFRAAFLSVRNLYWDGWEKEGIWIRPSSYTWGWETRTAPRSTPGTAFNYQSPVQRLVDDYRMKDGTSIDESPLYNENKFTNNGTQYYDKGTNLMFTEREARFYANITFNGAKNPGASKAGDSNSRVEFFSSGSSGKASAPRDWPTTGYTARKNIHPTFSVNPKITVNRPGMIIRLAELYLNYAEALNEADPGNPDITKYLNMVRSRAGLPEITTLISQDRMRDEIRLERRIELVFEGHRFFDVRRWMIPNEPGSNQGGPFFGMNMDAGSYLSDPDFHKRTHAFSRTAWQRKFYFMPYGQAEMDRNHQLINFPGY